MTNFSEFLDSRLENEFFEGVSGGSGLGAQEHELAMGQMTYLRKTSTGGPRNRPGRPAWAAGLGALPLYFGSAFFHLLLDASWCCVLVLHV